MATLCTDAITALTYCRAIAATFSRRWFSNENWKAMVRTDLMPEESLKPPRKPPPDPTSREDARSSVLVAEGTSCSRMYDQLVSVMIKT